MTLPDYNSVLENNVYEGETGDDQPFKPDQPPYQENKLPLTGQPLRFPRVQDNADGPQTVISTYKPRQAADVCDLWVSLVDFCSGGGNDCGCYSRSYYVPDMWNSLAYGCAQGGNNEYACSPDDYYCSVAETAFSNTDYCTLSPDAVKFAAVVPGNAVPDSQATQDGFIDDGPASTNTPTPASSPEPPPAPTTAESTSQESMSDTTTHTMTSPSTSTVLDTSTLPSSTSSSTSAASQSSRKSIMITIGPWMVMSSIGMFNIL